MAWTPVEYRKNDVSRIAETPSDAAQLEWDGWLPVGEANIPIVRNIIAAPVRPDNAPNGTIWFKSII